MKDNTSCSLVQALLFLNGIGRKVPVLLRFLGHHFSFSTFLFYLLDANPHTNPSASSVLPLKCKTWRQRKRKRWRVCFEHIFVRLSWGDHDDQDSRTNLSEERGNDTIPGCIIRLHGMIAARSSNRIWTPIHRL